MIMTIEQARDTLRVDGSSNDFIITPLLEAIPSYLTITTGVAEPEGNELCKTVARFILQLWYNPDGTDAERLQKVIDSLLKTIKADNTKSAN